MLLSSKLISKDGVFSTRCNLGPACTAIITCLSRSNYSHAPLLLGRHLAPDDASMGGLLYDLARMVNPRGTPTGRLILSSSKFEGGHVTPHPRPAMLLASLQA